MRTGCWTCRDRKVKCSKEKLQCLNCQRTNHICPGSAPATVFKARRASRQLRDTIHEVFPVLKCFDFFVGELRNTGLGHELEGCRDLAMFAQMNGKWE